MANDAVLYERSDGVGLLTLNQPDNGNRMSLELLESFEKRTSEAKADDELRCLVLTGSGRSFCAGANLAEPIQSSDESLESHQRSLAMYEPFLTLLDLEVPVVGALNGHAIGGGLGLTLLCDLRYAREDAKYGATFTRLGLHPGMAVTYFLPRLVGLPKASEWLFTARLFDGTEGARSGLFNEALPGPQVLPRALDVAKSIASNGPLATRATKRSLRELHGWDPRGAALHEAIEQSRTLETEEAREGITAALEQRTPRFR